MKYNDVLAEAVVGLAGRDQFHAATFELFRLTRRGRGWHEKELNQNVLEQLIQKNLLVANDYRLRNAYSNRFVTLPWFRPWHLYAAVSGLQRYQLANGFDQVFIQAEANEYFDLRYFEFGKDDQDGQVVAAAAKHFGAMKDFPFKAFNPPQVYHRDDFYGWENKILSSKSATPYQKAVAQSNRIDATGIGVAALGFAPWDLSKDKQRGQFIGFVRRYNEQAAPLPLRPALPSMAALAVWPRR